MQELGFPITLPSRTQQTELDEKGYTILCNVMNPSWLAALRQAFEEITAIEGTAAGNEVSQVKGVRRLSDLVNKGTVFDHIYLQPELLGCVAHVLGRPFKLHSLNGHDPLPGAGQQALHTDGGKTVGSTHVQHHVVNSMWMLDDLRPENGATRVIPGSQHKTLPVEKLVGDREADHPDQFFLCAPAGSVAVFNGSVWHSCTRNRTRDRRRVLHCAFILREQQQQTNQRTHLRPETAARISTLARYILDI